MERVELRWLLSSVLLLFGFAVSAAPTASLGGEAARAEVVDSGRYRILQREPRRADGATSAGYSSVVKTELLSGSTQVPLRLGEAFGFRFQLQTTETHGEWLPVQIVIHHPPMIDVRGQSSTGFVIDSAARRGDDGRYHNGAYYVLSDARELMAGRWRIELVHAGRTLISREFWLEAEDGRVAGTQIAEPELLHR